MNIETLRREAVINYGYGDEEMAAHFNGMADKQEAQIAQQAATEILKDWPDWAQEHWKKAGENARYFSQEFFNGLQQSGVVA